MPYIKYGNILILKFIDVEKRSKKTYNQKKELQIEALFDMIYL
jgi:hypothetical protein